MIDQEELLPISGVPLRSLKTVVLYAEFQHAPGHSGTSSFHTFEIPKISGIVKYTWQVENPEDWPKDRKSTPAWANRTPR